MHNSPLYAAIDLGSNSFHMLVVREVAGALRTVTKVKRKVRLAAGLDPEFRLSRAAMERGWDCLRLFSEQLQDIPADNIRVVGTATLRLATNVDEFLSEAEQVLNHSIEIISGEEIKPSMRGLLDLGRGRQPAGDRHRRRQHRADRRTQRSETAQQPAHGLRHLAQQPLR